MTLTTLRAKFRQKVFGNPNNTDASDSIVDGYLNEAYQYFLILALKSQGDWQINANFATIDTIAGKRDYAFDSTLLKINEVYIKSSSSGKYIKAKQRDVRDISTDPLTDHTPNTPEFDLLDNNIFIYLPEGAIQEVVAGIRIHYEESFTSLVDTDDEPKIPVAFQSFLYNYGAREYCEDKEIWNKVKSLGAKLTELSPIIEDYYSNRSEARRVNISFVEENYN
jgi:hypothetical protein